jgi:hypothetical protein
VSNRCTDDLREKLEWHCGDYKNVARKFTSSHDLGALTAGIIMRHEVRELRLTAFRLGEGRSRVLHTIRGATGCAVPSSKARPGDSRPPSGAGPSKRAGMKPALPLSAPQRYRAQLRANVRKRLWDAIGSW